MKRDALCLFDVCRAWKIRRQRGNAVDDQVLSRCESQDRADDVVGRCERVDPVSTGIVGLIGDASGDELAPAADDLRPQCLHPRARDRLAVLVVDVATNGAGACQLETGDESLRILQGNGLRWLAGTAVAKGGADGAGL